jgi:hypothetical protein
MMKQKKNINKELRNKEKMNLIEEGDVGMH